MTKIISYNLNGIRAAERKGLKEWMKAVDADVYCFQEIKAKPDQFDAEEYEKMGYFCQWFPAEKKGYSGVALLSKVEPKKVEFGIGNEFFDGEGRMITAYFDDLTVVSVYHPSGSSGAERLKLKFQWMDLFKAHFDQIEKKTWWFPATTTFVKRKSIFTIQRPMSKIQDFFLRKEPGLQSFGIRFCRQFQRIQSKSPRIFLVVIPNTCKR